MTCGSHDCSEVRLEASSQGMKQYFQKCMDGQTAPPPSRLARCLHPYPVALLTCPILIVHSLPHESSSHPPLTSHACFARGNRVFPLAKPPTGQQRVGSDATVGQSGTRHASALKPPNLAGWAPLEPWDRPCTCPSPTFCDQFAKVSKLTDVTAKSPQSLKVEIFGSQTNQKPSSLWSSSEDFGWGTAKTGGCRAGHGQRTA